MNLFEIFAKKTTEFAGSTIALMLAILSIFVWLISGPFFDFSDTWQLIANTATTLITYTMIFLLQRTQNKDSAAIQLKLNEIIAAIEGASNRLLNIEELSEKEIEILRKRYKSLADRTMLDEDRAARHSVEEIKED
jgi:low affinity Fe/Cu permease